MQPVGVLVPAEILLVEDDPGDVVLTREAFTDSKIRNNLHVVSDGVEAITFLRREGTFASAPRPDVVLLDVNLPRRDGREVLAEIRADDQLRHIPVVILASSEAEEDMLRGDDLRAAAYLIKPFDIAGFIAAVRHLDGLFVSVVRVRDR